MTPDRGMRGRVSWPVVVAVAGTLGLAGAAFVLSFTALRDLAALAGIPAAQSWLWPLVVDGVILEATISVVALRNATARARITPREYAVTTFERSCAAFSCRPRWTSWARCWSRRSKPYASSLICSASTGGRALDSSPDNASGSRCSDSLGRRSCRSAWTSVS